MPFNPPAQGTGFQRKAIAMSKSPSRRTLENRLARLGETLHRSSVGCFAQFEDGRISPWHIQNGTTRIACSSLSTVADYLDRREGNL